MSSIELPYWFSFVLSLWLFLGLPTSPAKAQTFVPDDRVVSDPTINLQDPEYDQISLRVT